MLLTDRVAVVTGGGSGIGRASALALAQAGARVVIGNRNQEQGEATVAQIRAAGGEAWFRQTDITDPEAVRALVGLAQDRYGRLDIAFNNAGVFGPIGPMADQRAHDLLHVLDVNVRGTFLCMQAELNAMLAYGQGVIINNASTTGIRNNTKGVSFYAAAKSAVISLTRSAALEYADRGLRINAIAPGRIRTEMLAFAAGGNPDRFAAVVPAGRLGTPEEVAEAVVWLASDAARFVNGHILAVDGAFLAS